MKTRILSAVIGILFALGVVILGAYFPITFDITFALIAFMCVFEGLSAKKLQKKLTLAVPCLVFSASFMFLYKWPYILICAAFVYIVALFLAMVFNHENLVFPDLSFALTITTLVTLGIWTIVYMYDLTSDNIGIFYILAALAIPWLADGGAYFGGSFFGKHKLCPKISPKKTVEGAVSGVLIGTGLPLVEGVIFTQFFFDKGVSVNYLNFAVICFFGSLISIIGDLSFSLIKRSCGIKDYGSLIPGHGGMLDRFDSVIFTAPLIMILNHVLPIICR